LDELLIFIEQEGPHAVDSSAWAWVGWLAGSCPLAEGYSVYTARALYQYIDHTLDYDDVSLCEQAGYFKTDETSTPFGGKGALEGEKAKLWYDKKAASAIINYEFLPAAKGEVAIYDVMGRIISKTTLVANQKLTIIDLLHIASGDYLYSIKSNKGFTQNGKFIVIR
jgi:hypothetical protein